MGKSHKLEISIKYSLVIILSKCTLRSWPTRIFCYRYATVLYYLNDVDEGGETAFPVVDEKTFDRKVRYTKNAS